MFYCQCFFRRLWVPVVGLDLCSGTGQVAALECPRHSIHYRSRSSPLSYSRGSTPSRGVLPLVPVVGLEFTTPIEIALVPQGFAPYPEKKCRHFYF